MDQIEDDPLESVRLDLSLSSTCRQAAATYPGCLERGYDDWGDLEALANIDAKNILHTGHRLFSCESAKVIDEPLQPEKSITIYSIYLTNKLTSG